MLRPARGWYGKAMISDAEWETHWITVDNFWLSFYRIMNDTDPIRLYHVYGLEVSDGMEKTGQPHSAVMTCSQSGRDVLFALYTPNQFDIAEIRSAISNEQEKWMEYVENTEFEGPREFVATFSDRFVFRDCDRVKLRIEDAEMKLIHPNGDETVLPVDETCDLHPEYRRNDAKWVQLTSGVGAQPESVFLHCSIAMVRDIVVHGLHRRWRNVKV